MTDDQTLAACAEIMPALKWRVEAGHYHGVSAITLGLGTLRVYAMVTKATEPESYFVTVGSEYIHGHGSATSHGQAQAMDLGAALVRAAAHLDYNLNEIRKTLYSDLVRRSKLDG